MRRNLYSLIVIGCAVVMLQGCFGGDDSSSGVEQDNPQRPRPDGRDPDGPDADIDGPGSGRRGAGTDSGESGAASGDLGAASGQGRSDAPGDL